MHLQSQPPRGGDREWTERLRQGDAEAFESIFRTHYAGMVGLVERMLRGDGATAEEIAQEVMLELWRRRGTLSIHDSLRGYLLRAARNRALNHLRHRKVERASEPYLPTERATAPTGTRGIEEEEIDRAVRAAMRELPPRCRKVFELSRVQGLKYTEIAELLGISVKAVEAQMGRALRALRDRLAPWMPGQGDP